MHSHLPTERLDVPLLGQNEQISDFPVISRIARFVLEPVESREAQKRHPGVDLGVEMIADAAGTFGGRFRPEQVVALEQNDVFRPAFRQMVGRRSADHASAGDDDVRRLGYVHLFFHKKNLFVSLLKNGLLSPT